MNAGKKANWRSNQLGGERNWHGSTEESCDARESVGLKPFSSGEWEIVRCRFGGVGWVGEDYWMYI